MSKDEKLSKRILVTIVVYVSMILLMFPLEFVLTMPPIQYADTMRQIFDVYAYFLLFGLPFAKVRYGIWNLVFTVLPSKLDNHSNSSDSLTFDDVGENSDDKQKEFTMTKIKVDRDKTIVRLSK